MSTNNTYTVSVTPEENSTVKIEGEITFSEVEKHRNAALKALGKNVTLDGFRPGHIPEKVLVEHIGEGTLLGEMAERALAEIYPQIVREHTLDVIGHPQISITKLAPGNPLGFTAQVAVVPTFSLPDYKKIAKEITKELPKVTDEDLEKTIKDVLRQKTAYERLQQKAAAEKSADGTTTLPTPENVQQDKEVTDDELPELTDEYVKTLGNFASVDDFKQKLREHVTKEKEQESVGKHRGAITDAIIEKTEINVPQVLTDAEVGQMFGQMEQDLTRANLTIDDYLTHIKKTKEELATEWKPAAEKRAKIQLVLNKIAEEEKIQADKSKVDHEVSHLLSHYKDADPERVRLYVETMLKNEAVMQMLEGASS